MNIRFKIEKNLASNGYEYFRKNNWECCLMIKKKVIKFPRQKDGLFFFF